ncbi:S-layer homology domain-containing protein [Paenibacillus sp. FSL W7-1287]|uniref:S-layer homology domain-containing protein n=1 Tax=Paenibacillus sp. FSL W7-1287 TaxID=2954538 RepID=UPI0030F96739
MKKKALLASAVALVTASAMTFAPVSYKVIDKASAATADVEKAANKLAKIYAVLNSEDNTALAAAYDALLAEVEADAAQLVDLNGTKLEAGLGVAKASAVQLALVDLVKAVAVEYNTDNAQFSDLSDAVEGKLDALKLAFGDIAEGVTRDDLAKLLESIQTAALAEIAEFEYTAGLDYSDLVYSSVLAAVEAEWNKADNNEIVAVLKEVYGAANFADFESDVEAAKESFKQYVEAEGNASVYKKGAAALAISYANYHLSEVQQPLLPNYTGSSIVLNPDLFGVSALPLSALAWETSDNATIAVNDEGDLVLSVLNYGATTVTAKLKANPKLPQEFVGTVLFSQTVNVSPIGGGITGPIFSGNLELVADYEAKAKAIAGAVDAFLAENPELYNNTLTFELKRLIEKYVREALLVQAAGAVTVQNGVSTLGVSPASMENIYNTQLKTVQDAVTAALEAKGIKLDINTVMTYNIGISSNALVSVSKELKDSLASKGIDTVGVKTGDAAVEIALDQLESSSTVSIKKSESKVAGAKSDLYSIAVKDADGKALTAFEKQYRVTLPVNGNGSNVTVAHVTGGSQTLVGGQYDPATKTITFYTNQLGDFVVVENNASFNDTADIAWAKDQIQELANKGLLLGKGNGKFDPNGDVTRAEFTAMLVRAFNLNASADITFSDVSENAWYYDAVSAARAYGIINGRSASTFDPNAKISREEMASIAANALKAVLGYQPAAKEDEILDQFVDGDKVVAVHRANVALVKNEGIIQGKGKDNYDPKGDATRAEASVILAKILDRR